MFLCELNRDKDFVNKAATSLIDFSPEETISDHDNSLEDHEIDEVETM